MPILRSHFSMTGFVYPLDTESEGRHFDLFGFANLEIVPSDHLGTIAEDGIIIRNRVAVITLKNRVTEIIISRVRGVPTPQRTLDVHDELPLTLNFTEFAEILDADPLASIDSITCDDSDMTFDSDDWVLDVAGQKVSFIARGGEDTEKRLVEVICLRESGYRITGHVTITWKEGASQEVQ